MRKVMLGLMFIITAILIVVVGETPAQATAPPASDTAAVECVPEGDVVTDVNTGDTYIYGVPTQFGYDTCGNAIPDICVQWPDGHYSKLWSTQPCDPVPEVTESTEIETSTPEVLISAVTPEAAQQLPATGSEINVALVALLSLALGTGLIWTARRKPVGN